MPSKSFEQMSNDWFASSYLIQIKKENQLFQEKGSLNNLAYLFYIRLFKHLDAELDNFCFALF